MKQEAISRPRGGWHQEENDLLFSAVRQAGETGTPLRDVFVSVGEQLRRKPNSIRNYYYAKVKEEPELAPGKSTFRAFDREELHQLLRDVLVAKGQGESVRACVIRRAEGDRSAMLRYQNKYRSVLKNRPELLEQVAEELRREGLPCPDNVVSCRRYSPEEGNGCLHRLPEGWDREPGVAAMLEGLNTLLRRMEAQTAALQERSEAERLSRPADGMQVPYEKWLKARQEADRLRVEVDLLKIALEEAEQGKAAEPEKTTEEL